MNSLLFVSLIFSIIEWIGEQKKRRILIYSSKPFVLITLIIWMILNINFSNFNSGTYEFRIIWFLFGLFFCLLGDIFLMLPDKFFLPGLVVFLIGHIFYIIGFGKLLPPARNYVPGILLFLVVLFVSFTAYKKLKAGLIASGKKSLAIPVAIYAIVISVMLFSAIISLLDREWHYSAALLVSLGALSFYISDIMNAWMRFVEIIPAGRLKIMITYHLSQIAITIGAVLHYIYPPES